MYFTVRVEVNGQSLPDYTGENQGLWEVVVLAWASLGDTHMEMSLEPECLLVVENFLVVVVGFPLPCDSFLCQHATLCILVHSCCSLCKHPHLFWILQLFCSLYPSTFICSKWITLSLYWKICLVSVNVCLLLVQISFAKSLNIISLGQNKLIHL